MDPFKPAPVPEAAVPSQTPAAAPAPLVVATPGFEIGPTPQELLERAARLGPPRPTLESILLPTDPVLGQKLHPRIAERRMRLTRIVKATLGGCVALCVAALVATAMSGEAEAAPKHATEVAVATPVSRAPSVESLSGATLGKATHAKAVRTKMATRGKRR